MKTRLFQIVDGCLTAKFVAYIPSRVADRELIRDHYRNRLKLAQFAPECQVTTSPIVLLNFVRTVQSLTKKGILDESYVDDVLKGLHWSVVGWDELTAERSQALLDEDTYEDLRDLFLISSHYTIYLHNIACNPAVAVN